MKTTKTTKKETLTSVITKSMKTFVGCRTAILSQKFDADVLKWFNENEDAYSRLAKTKRNSLLFAQLLNSTPFVLVKGLPSYSVANIENGLMAEIDTDKPAEACFKDLGITLTAEAETSLKDAETSLKDNMDCIATSIEYSESIEDATELKEQSDLRAVLADKQISLQKTVKAKDLYLKTLKAFLVSKKSL